MPSDSICGSTSGVWRASGETDSVEQVLLRGEQGGDVDGCFVEASLTLTSLLIQFCDDVTVYDVTNDDFKLGHF